MKRLLVLAIGAAALGTLLATGAGASDVTAAAKGQKIVLRRTHGLGRILRDAHGRVVYLFEKDRTKRSRCYGACAAYWPPVLTKGKPRAGKGVKRRKLRTTRRRGGKRQVTYNGHPLYYYVGDSKPGDANGQGIDTFGAEWWVLSKRGRKIEKR